MPLTTLISRRIPSIFDNGAEQAVEASHIHDVTEAALRYFLDFVRLQSGQLGA